MLVLSTADAIRQRSGYLLCPQQLRVRSMDATTQLSSFVALMVGLSIATERLVEIIKGLFPILNCEASTAAGEGRRKAALQFLAVLSGIATAWLAQPYIPSQLAGPASSMGVIGLGLLASGGSGFWNSIATWMLKLKDLKEAEVKRAKS